MFGDYRGPLFWMDRFSQKAVVRRKKCGKYSDSKNLIVVGFARRDDVVRYATERIPGTAAQGVPYRHPLLVPRVNVDDTVDVLSRNAMKQISDK